MTKNIKLRDGGSWLNLTPIYGLGFPDGVVSAPVGSIYIDKDITNGASSWIKKSGTGDTGWQVLEGDTGWRDIGDLVTVGEVTPTQPTKIRRINDQIYFTLRREAVTIGSGVTILTTPSGWHTWHGNERMYHMGARGNSGLIFRILGLPSGLTGAVQTPQGGTENEILTLNATWATTIPWPSTLPGTAV